MPSAGAGTDCMQQMDVHMESRQDSVHAQNKAVTVHSHGTAIQGSSQCCEVTESGVQKTQNSVEDCRQVSSKGLANVVRNNPDPHSPIWLPGLDYPVQYCVRHTRSMSQMIAPFEALEDMELPAARRWKSMTERSMKKHTAVKDVHGPTDTDNSMNDVPLCVGSCQSRNGISGTSPPSKTLAIVPPQLVSSRSYLCTIRTPGGLGECHRQVGASSCEVPVIQLQVSDLGCVEHEIALGCRYSGMKC